MARVTVVTLRNTVDEVNGWLEDAGLSTRLETGGRNGYQAIDEYSVRPDGSREGSGCNRNVCCGSSRECVSAAYDYWNACSREADRAELEALRASVGCTGDDDCRCEHGCEG
jgi:hypothetical protein